ncbi:MAG: metallophosphoesterase [Cyclobacteriaceae bacterium]|nr:metallophosphoesterase [Cyclobacteriaceae bacterium]
MRRRFLLKAGLAGALSFGPRQYLKAKSDSGTSGKGSFSMDGHRLGFYHSEIKESFNIMMISDTHLFMNDEREEPFRQYSGRMAGAYNKTQHFQTGIDTHPEECFSRSLSLAKENGVDLIALIGDIFSFPAEAAIEWVTGKLRETGIPFIYTSGNHDWHYEGMTGSMESLRQEWISKRLLPMYQGEHPLMSTREIKGVLFVAIDNSYYEIVPEQLTYLNQAIATGKPVVLMCHIPMYMPGRGLGYGCGHPGWSAASDRNYELERREPWRQDGHTETTMLFHKTLFDAPNVIGVLSGHVHRYSLDVFKGIPQITADANAKGARLDVAFDPFPQ